MSVDSSGGAGRAALAFGIVLGVMTPGCAWKTVSASCRNVPNPVLLGPVDRIRGHAAEANVTKVGEVDADVEASITVSNHTVGNVTYTSTRSMTEGANKASYAVMAATNGDPSTDVRLSGLTSGAYVFFPIASVQTSFWVGVHGEAVKAK
jgi:hypothetical protein